MAKNTKGSSQLPPGQSSEKAGSTWQRLKGKFRGSKAVATTPKPTQPVPVVSASNVAPIATPPPPVRTTKLAVRRWSSQPAQSAQAAKPAQATQATQAAEPVQVIPASNATPVTKSLSPVKTPKPAVRRWSTPARPLDPLVGAELIYGDFYRSLIKLEKLTAEWDESAPDDCEWAKPGGRQWTALLGEADAHLQGMDGHLDPKLEGNPKWERLDKQRKIARQKLEQVSSREKDSTKRGKQPLYLPPSGRTIVEEEPLEQPDKTELRTVRPYWRRLPNGEYVEEMYIPPSENTRGPRNPDASAMYL